MSQARVADPAAIVFESRGDDSLWSRIDRHDLVRTMVVAAFAALVAVPGAAGLLWPVVAVIAVGGLLFGCWPILAEAW